MDEGGNPYLAPYSFFNVFSSNPPILVFSSSRRVSDNTTKDTLLNARQTRQIVINVVSYSFVRKMAVTSIQYLPGVNEFTKSGLTALPSHLVAPPRVAESPAQFECQVIDIVPLGDQGGAGNLVISEVLLIHLSDEVLDENNRINPHKMDLMGRMGRSFYTRASGESIYSVYQPTNKVGIGYDQLPLTIRESRILTANNLGQLAGITEPPAEETVLDLTKQPRVQAILESDNPLEELHYYVQIELEKENTELAARIAWLGEKLSQQGL